MMNRRFIFWALCILAPTGALFSQQARLDIQVAKPGAKINPGLYGVFFEDINHGVQGGLDGELINNRDFEAANQPEDMIRSGDTIRTIKGWRVIYKAPDSLEGWYLKKSDNQEESEVHLVSDHSLNTTNKMHLQFDVRKQYGASLINKGYWGISIAKSATYQLSFYAYANTGFSGQLRVSLQSTSGKLYCSRVIGGIGGKWKKISCSLVSNTTDPNACFVLTPLSTGTLWLDVVSLFPKNTFMGHPNGLRQDIAQKIADIKPGFIRFPGGCIVEGANLDNRIKWFNTIGNIAKRPGHWNLWGYHTTDGVGFAEYLQFCQDLHTDAMYVFPVGMSCQFRKCEYVSVDSLKPYIEEVLNALQYALGPVDSKYGSLRAKNGHPKPYNIKYVEIGNENYGPLYQQRYGYFYDAIKRNYPGITTITCTDPSMRSAFKLTDLGEIDSSKVEMIDEHFYESPDFFYKNVHRYDTYNRKGPKVYVGEFAVKKWDNSLTGNLEAALAEAAFYTGIERNADVVKLASLAPTLVNDHDHTWNPDLITFNSSNSYGSPSYQAIKLFQNNLADHVLPVKLDYTTNAVHVISEEKGHGILEFSNPDADCLYRDVKVSVDDSLFQGNNLFSDDLLVKKEKEGWHVGVQDHLILPFKQSVLDYGNKNDWKDYTVSFQAYARVIHDLEGFNINFWSLGINKHWQLDLGRWRRMYWLEWYDHGYSSYFGEARGDINEKRWYNIKIKVDPDSVFTYLDEKLIHSVAKPVKTVPGMYVSAGVKNNNEVIVKMVNATGIIQHTDIHLDGAKGILDRGESEIISSGNVLDENSFDDPEKISPKKATFTGVKNRFNYDFAPHSITILKLRINANK